MSGRDPRSVIRVAPVVAALVTLLPVAVAGQGTWYPGGRAAALVRLDRGEAGPGLKLHAFLGRSQTPRVEIRGGAGFRWFPHYEIVQRFRLRDVGQVIETRSEEILGPHLSMSAARALPAGRVRVLLQATVELGVLRERVTSTSTHPASPRRLELTDWEVTPTWAVGTTVVLPEWAALSVRPEIDGRLTVITLAGVDDYIPTLSFAVGWSRSPGGR